MQTRVGMIAQGQIHNPSAVDTWNVCVPPPFHLWASPPPTGIIHRFLPLLWLLPGAHALPAPTCDPVGLFSREDLLYTMNAIDRVQV